MVFGIIAFGIFFICTGIGIWAGLTSEDFDHHKDTEFSKSSETDKKIKAPNDTTHTEV